MERRVKASLRRLATGFAITLQGPSMGFQITELFSQRSLSQK
jgi:hypothetical protein